MPQARVCLASISIITGRSAPGMWVSVPLSPPMRRKPGGYGRRDGTGGKRGAFPPPCERGKHEHPRAAGRRRKRRGDLTRMLAARKGRRRGVNRNRKLWALRGGDSNTTGAGLFGLLIRERRLFRGWSVGFRPALASHASEARRLRPPGRNRRQKGFASSPVRKGETWASPRGR